MKIMTLGTYLATWWYLVTCHWQFHMSHQEFDTWQIFFFFKKFKKKIKIKKKLKKIKKSRGWHVAR